MKISSNSSRSGRITTGLMLAAALCLCFIMGAWQSTSTTLADEAGERSVFVQSGGAAADIAPAASATAHASAPSTPDVATNSF